MRDAVEGFGLTGKRRYSSFLLATPNRSIYLETAESYGFGSPYALSMRVIDNMLVRKIEFFIESDKNLKGAPVRVRAGDTQPTA